MIIINPTKQLKTYKLTMLDYNILKQTTTFTTKANLRLTCSK